MTDKKMIKQIIDCSNLSKEDVVLEIGPGKGALTKEIAKIVKRLTCIEIDTENEKYLKNIENCDLIIGNALNYVDTILFDKIISNLPYSLSEPLFRKLIKVDFKLCVFTISEHFYNVICDEEKKLHYLVNSFFQIKYVCEVPKDAFKPKPDTNSCVVIIRPKKEKTTFDRILCSFFKQDDKLLKNALINAIWNELKVTKRDAKKIVESLEISKSDATKNMDLISNENFLKIIFGIKKAIEEK